MSQFFSERDWSNVRSYIALANAAAEAHDLAPAAFLNGPFRRFLEMCSTDEHCRLRARIMEFGREALTQYAESLKKAGGNKVELLAQARAMASDWFRKNHVHDADYMLEVMDGQSTHNYRGKESQQT